MLSVLITNWLWFWKLSNSVTSSTLWHYKLTITSVLNVSTYINTAMIQVLSSVSTFITAIIIILYTCISSLVFEELDIIQCCVCLSIYQSSPMRLHGLGKISQAF